MGCLQIQARQTLSLWTSCTHVEPSETIDLGKQERLSYRFALVAGLLSHGGRRVGQQF